MQRMINEGFFLKLRWKSGLFLKLHWIFLSCNPVKTPKTPDSILKLRWTVHNVLSLVTSESSCFLL
jgi:hypothetical protein